MVRLGDMTVDKRGFYERVSSFGVWYKRRGIQRAEAWSTPNLAVLKRCEQRSAEAAARHTSDKQATVRSFHKSLASWPARRRRSRRPRTRPHPRAHHAP